MAIVEPASLRITSRRHVVRGGAMVMGGTAVFQASNFLYNALAARALGPAAYGDLAAVVGLIMLTSPVFMTVQTVASRTATALYVGGRARELRGLVRFYAARLGFVAILAGCGMALFSGPAAELLHLHSSLPLVLLPAVLMLATISHLQRGVLQGLQRFAVFGWGAAFEGITKVVAVAALLGWIWRTDAGAVLALAIASACAIAFNGAFVHKLPDTTERVHPVDHPFRYSLATFGTLSLLAMLLSADVIAANRYLSTNLAGVYAAISLSGKTVFFATSALTLFAFPIFGEHQDVGRDSRPVLLALLGSVAAVSAVVVASLAVAPTLVVGTIFGPRFLAAAPFVPWAGIAFAGYSLVYLIGLYLLSQRRTVGIWVLGVAAVAQLAGFRLMHGDVWQLLAVQFVVLGGAAVALLVLAIVKASPRQTDVDEDSPWQP